MHIYSTNTVCASLCGYILVEQDLYSLCAHYAYNNYCLQSTVGAGLAGVEELKAHPFFASVDWNSV